MQQELKDAKAHIKFCVSLYEIQIRAGRYFLHEHPAGASSWKMKEMTKLMLHPEVDAVTFDMCCFGMVASKDGEEGPVRKRTTALNNLGEIQKRLNRVCPNEGGEREKHVHVALEGGLAKQAQV